MAVGVPSAFWYCTSVFALGLCHYFHPESHLLLRKVGTGPLVLSEVGHPSMIAHLQWTTTALLAGTYCMRAPLVDTVIRKRLLYFLDNSP